MVDPAEQASELVVAETQTEPRPTASSGAFGHLLAEHGEVFASAKRLGMRLRELEVLDERVGGERFSHEPHEVAELCAALREVVLTEASSGNDAQPSDLADAIAALDAINPGSPEWGPTFLQVSELVEARVR